MAWPKITKHIEVYKNHGCSGQGSGRSKGCNYKKEDRVVAAVFRNKNEKIFGSDYCHAFISYDKDNRIKAINGAKNEKTKIKDTYENKRITFKKIKPGKGGKGASIIIKARDKGNFSDWYLENGDGGDGYYFHGDDSGLKNVTFLNERGRGDDSGICTGISIKAESYHCLYINSVSTDIGNIVIKNWEARGDFRTITGKRVHSIKIPSDAHIKSIKNFFEFDKSYGPPSSNTKDISTNTTFYKHPDQILAEVSYLADRLEKCSPCDKSKKEAFVKEANSLLRDIQKVLDQKDNYKNFSAPELLNIAETKKSYLLKIIANPTRNLDAFNNPPGYRPVLSLESTLSYLKNNLDDDLRLFIRADKMASKEADMDALIKQIPAMLEDLQKSNDQYHSEFDGLKVNYADLQKQVKTCDKLTKKIKGDLKTLESSLKKDAENWKMKKDVLVAVLKGASLAASVIPYGQPALGEFVGQPLSVIAKGIDENKGSGSIAENVMSQLNVEKTFDALAKNSLPKVDPKSPEFVSLDSASASSVIDIKRYNDELNAAATESANAQFQKNLKEKKARLNTATKGILDINSHLMKSMAKMSDIEQKLASLKESNAKYQGLYTDLKVQLRQKQDIFDKLNGIIQKSVALNARLSKNADQMLHLKRIQLKADELYDPGVQALMQNIRDSAIDRIGLIEYQLVKVYEYTTMSKYTASMPATAALIREYNKEKNSINESNLNSKVSRLADVINGVRSVMYGDIIKNISDNHKQDGTESDQEGREIFLSYSEAEEDLKLNHLLKVLNEENEVIINTQADVAKVIEPGEQNTRVIDIFLESVTLNKDMPQNRNLTITIELDSEGVLRKGENFYLFDADNHDLPIYKRTFTVKSLYNGQTKVRMTSHNSEKFNSLIEFITGQKDTKLGKKQRLFTLPPAWGFLKITLDYDGKQIDKPEITSLVLNMKCDYEDLKKSDKHILDIRSESPYPGVQLTLDNKGQKELLLSNKYKFLEQGDQVTLTIDETTIAKTIKFFSWDVHNATAQCVDNPKDRALKCKSIKLTMGKRDALVKALFIPTEKTAPYTEKQQSSRRRSDK